MNNELYKQEIRKDYRGTLEGAGKVLGDIQSTNLRHVLEALIKFKNSFPRHELSNFDIVDSQFNPQSDSYIQGLIYSQALLIWIPLFLLIIFAVFILGRFCFKKCEATLERDESVTRSSRGYYICWTWINTFLLLSSVAVTVFGNYGYI